MTTDEVSRLMHPGRGVYVDGDDVDIDLVWCFRVELGFDFPTTAGAGDTGGELL